MRIETSAQALEITAVLDPTTLAGTAIPDSTSRAVLVVRLPGHTVTAEVAAKSLRLAVAAIAEHGVDGVAVVLQGRLDGGSIAEAVVAVMPKTPKAANE